MIRECEKCGTVYDDVARWTLCPHGPLGGGNRYCREHDLDPCPFCDPTATNPLVMPSPPPPPGRELLQGHDDRRHSCGVFQFNDRRRP